MLIKPICSRLGISLRDGMVKYALVHCSSLILLFLIPEYTVFPLHPVHLGYAKPYILILWLVVSTAILLIFFIPSIILKKLEKFLSVHAGLILLFIILSFALSTFYIALIKYLRFGGYYEDSAHFVQSLYNCTSGKFDIVTVQGKSLLGIHFSPFLYLFVPVYYLFRYPPTIFFLRSCFISLSILPLYLTPISTVL